MKSNKLKLGILLFILGFTGILSTLLLDIPLPEKYAAEINKVFSPELFKVLSLINPTIMLVGAIFIGVYFHEKVNLKVPILKSFISKTKIENAASIIKYGIIGGIIAGLLISVFTYIFLPFLPDDFIKISEKFKLPVLTRFLYGGITEEVLIRFGFMTFLVWLMHTISKSLNNKIYWVAIIISAIAFGIGHLPIVFMLVGNPTIQLVFYIIIGNVLGGLIFGYLYWKKGLEAAIIAHIFTHIVMLLGESFFN